MADALIHPRVAALLVDDQGILETYGIKVTRALHGVCELQAVVPAKLVNAGGLAHGSIAFALMDTACAYALGSLEVRGVTLNANTTYVKGAHADSSLVTTVTVMSRTRRVASLRGETLLRGEGVDELAAHGTFVFQLKS